jgi:predicted  nucleic acid-binding Zn-ribbon protein
MGENPIQFESIKVEGYRGRNFTLNMRPKGEHSVFFMDNNVGKTTLIDLIRWCFKYNQNDAAGNFSHMWDEYTHVLDYKIKGPQECKIIINFNDGQTKYRFTRVTKGEHNLKTRTINGKTVTIVGNDKIEEIYDQLDIDNGKDHREKEAVFQYLNLKFKLAQSVDFFCFDGEKAEKIMKNSQNKKTITDLIQSVNQRASHPKVIEYKQNLEALKDSVYRTAKKTGGGKASDNAIERRISNIQTWNHDKDEKHKELTGLNDEKRIYEGHISDLTEKTARLNNEITTAKSKSLIELNRLEGELKNTKSGIEGRRKELYENMKNWLSFKIENNFELIKNNVKESGKLPEPYRNELIKSCLNSIPPTCQICGRKLDNVSSEYVKQLEKTMASPRAHAFLIEEYIPEDQKYDVSQKRTEITELIQNISTINLDIANLALSEEDKILIQERDECEKKKEQAAIQLGDIRGEIKATNEIIKDLEQRIADEQKNIETLTKYLVILDKIDQTYKTLGDAQHRMEEVTVSIIGNVISDSVTSVLGEEYTAILDQELGLMLAQDNVAGRDLGGYASRITLSYCFAEAMSTIGSIIVDTPSGNIGMKYRLALSKHLRANHNQVVLLCHSDEIVHFADQLSDKIITITNQNTSYEEDIEVFNGGKKIEESA